MEHPATGLGSDGRESGERRHIVLLFADLCDYTAITELVDPEEMDTLRRHVEQSVASICQRHGGLLSQCYGDGNLAVFGFPTPSESDVLAAIEAALELHHAMPALSAETVLPPGFELRMHSGVHSGLCFVRAGDPLHGRFDFTGDTVNTAARLCAAAQRDEILVSEGAMRGVEPFFDALPVPALELKGKRLPLTAYRVIGRSDVRTRFEASTRRGLTTFVNRFDEMSQLNQAIADARQQRTRVVGLLGSAGIGKSRLLEEFLRSLDRGATHVYRGTCERDAEVAPLRPFVQIVRQLFGLQEDAPAELVSAAVERLCAAEGEALRPHAEVLLHAPALGSLPDAQDLPLSLASSLLAVIATLGPGPLVLAIDDWQWGDDLSRQVLHALIKGVEGRGLLVVLAWRETQPEASPAATQPRPPENVIELRPLPHEESTRVIQSLCASELTLGLTHAIHERSGGNPLFLEELCRSLPTDSPGAPLRFDPRQVPHTLAGVIQVRMERLPPVELALLRMASVIGNEFSAGLLDQIRGGRDSRAILEQLSHGDLVRQSEGQDLYRFKHGLTRDVLYESVLLAERRRLHAAVADALQGRALELGRSEPHEALAYHHAGSGNHERAVHYAELAGDKAAASSSLDRARLQYGGALAELDKLPATTEVKRRWLAVSVKWARAWVYYPALDQLPVLERSARCAEELGDMVSRADALQMAAWICYALGEQERAIAHCTRGLELAERAGSYKLVGQLLSNLGQSHAAAGEYPAALEHLQRAVQLKREHAARRSRAVPVGSGYALGVIATIHAERGDFESAVTHMARALEMLRGSDHAIEASVLGLRAMNELWQGEWDRCIDTCQRARAVAERIHGPHSFAINQGMSSYARFMTGGAREELAHLCDAADWLQSRNMGLYLSALYGCAAEGLLAIGDHELAHDYAARALARAEQRDPFGAAAAHRVRASLYARARQGDPRVDSELRAALQVAELRDSSRETALTRLTQAGLYRDAGQLEAARDCAERALRAFSSMGMQYHRLQAERALAAAAAPA